ncbi:nurim-like [Scyliorhinus canicula]|uniref:nurim-like n=1 Tax=Scyliorhinus canicula TaxID=7830 RepID=UPI0018F35511|nr:nurim-like [Scyliorhinus canicula]
MAVFHSAALVSLSLANFVFVSWSAAEFVAFVSLRQIYRESGRPGPAGVQVHTEWQSAFRDKQVQQALLSNLALLAFFILQHSVMATETVRRWTQACFGVLQRSVYVFFTAAFLQLLMHYWQPTHAAPFLWNVSREPWITCFPLVCFIIHVIAWLIIFSIVLIFDYAELMGLKQVYYCCLALGDPMVLKSQKAQRLYCHLRHPVFLEFLIILWVLPSLSLDRLLLSTTFTLYMICGHSLDQQDYRYLRSQLNKKFEIFSREESSFSHLAARNGVGEHTGHQE